jgi:hypothetical protein
MLEDLFVTTGSDGHAVHTPMGLRHVQLLQEYAARINRVAKPLCDDCPRFRPIDGSYSPYGVLYGFTTNLIEHMAFKTSHSSAATRFSLEDVFSGGDGEKLAWVSGWRKLPHLKREVTALFDYPQQFAEAAFARVADALNRRVSGSAEDAVVPGGRLFVLPAGGREGESAMSPIADLPRPYIRSSDPALVTAQRADEYDEAELLRDRREGKFIVSYKTAGGWVAVTKALLTEVLGAGRNAKIEGVPRAAADALKLMCPGLVVFPEDAPE